MAACIRRASLLALTLTKASEVLVTPVQKVVGLLKGLEAKIGEDGKTEAVAYDKYACFCKEQVDNKIYMIEKSDKKVSALTDVVQNLGAELSALSGDISGLAQTILNLENDILGAKNIRNQDHEAYLKKDADVTGAIDAIQRATVELKQSKGGLTGKVDLEVAQIQMGAHATGNPLTAEQVGLLSTFQKSSQPGEAYQYEYHANDIIATLEGLLVTFKNNKNKFNEEEFDANAAFERQNLAMENEKAFTLKAKTEKEKLEAFKTEDKNEKEQAKTQEVSELEADKAFLKVLTNDCQDKASAWDQRSKTRAEELTAISEAMEALTTGVVPNWAANRRLVGLQKAGTDTQAPAAASFLQLRGSGRRASQADEIREKASLLLSRAAQLLHSPILSAAALKIRTSKDVFAKVRSIIKDVISKLEDQSKNEASLKSFCDNEMASAIGIRDQKNEELEGLDAQITSSEAEMDQLKKEIAELSEAIAKNEKALKEATELRLDEKKDNQKVEGEATVGKEAVQFALKLLKDFYGGPALVQRRSEYVPPNSDREGNTVADLAPKGFDSTEYKGRQQAAKGILGLLEVILSDFDRTAITVEAAEFQSAGEFEQFEGFTKQDTRTKKDDKKKKEGDVTELKNKLVGLVDDKNTRQQALTDALSELQKLHSMCVAGEETFEERVAKREKEIEALKEAHSILEDWQR